MERICRGYQQASSRNSSYRDITELKEYSITISLPQGITNSHANHFASISSDQNYDKQFTPHKISMESQPINFDSQNLSYMRSQYKQPNYTQRFIQIFGTLDCLYSNYSIYSH